MKKKHPFHFMIILKIVRKKIMKIFINILFVIIVTLFRENLAASNNSNQSLFSANQCKLIFISNIILINIYIFV